MASPWSFGRSALASGESSRRELEGLNHTNGHNAGTRLGDLLAQHAKGLGAVPPARRNTLRFRRSLAHQLGGALWFLGSKKMFRESKNNITGNVAGLFV
jgi:hypothetical protein